MNDFCFRKKLGRKKVNKNLVEKIKQDYHFRDILSRLNCFKKL